MALGHEFEAALCQHGLSNEWREFSLPCAVLAVSHAIEERSNEPQRREERGEKRVGEGALANHLSVKFDLLAETGSVSALQ